MSHGIDAGSCLIQTVIGQDRKHGAKNLFLHNGIVKGNLIHKGWGDTEPVRVIFSATYCF